MHSKIAKPHNSLLQFYHPRAHQFAHVTCNFRVSLQKCVMVDRLTRVGTAKAMKSLLKRAGRESISALAEDAAYMWLTFPTASADRRMKVKLTTVGPGRTLYAGALTRSPLHEHALETSGYCSRVVLLIPCPSAGRTVQHTFRSWLRAVDGTLQGYRGNLIRVCPVTTSGRAPHSTLHSVRNATRLAELW